MSKLPGSAGVSLLGDKSLEFYRDPVSFCRQRIEKHGSRVFQCRLLNRPTTFICSVRGMRELLCGRLASARVCVIVLPCSRGLKPVRTLYLWGPISLWETKCSMLDPTRRGLSKRKTRMCVCAFVFVFWTRQQSSCQSVRT